MLPPQLIDLESIKVPLGKGIIGTEVRLLDEVPSTNDVALEAGESGEPEGLVVIAERQTAGRGRLGRSWWNDGENSVAFSFLLRPPASVLEGFSLSLGAGLAVSKAIVSLMPEAIPNIKWPNDILIGGRKVCGILGEARQVSGPSTIGTIVVIGIGINVSPPHHGFPDEFSDRATSLWSLMNTDLLNANPSRSSVIRAVIDEFNGVYQSLLDNDFQTIHDEVAKRLVHVGHHCRLSIGERTVEGTIQGIDWRGALEIKTEEGTKAFDAGELELLEIET